MEKRYTLPVAIALVVGTVIGSGVFFKAEAVLTKTGGNLSVGILAFIIMGVVMIISACTFGVVAQSHEGVEGLVGYAAASCGKTYSYYVGWFMAVIYYPSLVSVLSWLPARYFGVLMGWEDAEVAGGQPAQNGHQGGIVDNGHEPANIVAVSLAAGGGSIAHQALHALVALGHDAEGAGADDHDDAHDDERQNTDSQIAAGLGQNGLGLKKDAGTDDSAHHQCDGYGQGIPFFHSDYFPFSLS